MNARQAAKAASLKIEELERLNAICQTDIKAYNLVIDDLIAGKSPCPWCEDLTECQRDEKNGAGCRDWWLTYDPEKLKTAQEGTNEGERILSAGPSGRE